MKDSDSYVDDEIIKYNLDYNITVNQTKYELKEQDKTFNYNINDYYLYVIIYIYKILI